MKTYDYLGFLAITSLSTEKLFQLISIGLACISFIISICFTIYNWHKKAKEDGKIDDYEIKALAEIGKQAIEDSKELVNTAKDIINK